MSFEIVDEFKDKPKIFDSMQHEHGHGIPLDATDPDCLKCKFTIQEDSIPKKQFNITDRKGTIIKITRITLHRGRFNDCIGWSF